jgi:4'-phosphopantetheinyl transferase
MRNNTQYHIECCRECTVRDLENEIHVWTYDLVQPITVLREYKELLDQRELRQYNSYYFAKEKRQYLAAKGFIKKLLSQYLQTNIKEIKLSKSILGEPYMINNNVVETIQFSVSHSNELAAFSLSKEKTGIDIEYMKRAINYQKIAKLFLSNKEYKKYRNTPDSDKKRFFYDMWTRKEATIKFIGDKIPVDQRDIIEIKHEIKNKKTIFKFIREDMKKEIITYTFQPQEHYIGALATIKGKLKRIFHCKKQSARISYLS